MTIERTATSPPPLQVSLDQREFVGRVHTDRLGFVLARIRENTTTGLCPGNEGQEVPLARARADRRRTREAMQVVDKCAPGQTEQSHIAVADERHRIALATMEDTNDPVVCAALQVDIRLLSRTRGHHD